MTKNYLTAFVLVAAGALNGNAESGSVPDLSSLQKETNPCHSKEMKLNVKNTDEEFLSLKKATRADNTDFPEPITEVQGEEKIYKSKKVYYNRSYYGDLSLVETEGLSYFIYGEDNNVYLKNPLAGFSYGNTYIKGEKLDDGKIKVILPQTVYYDRYDDPEEGIDRTTVVTADLVKFDFKENEDGELTFDMYYADEESDYVEFLVDPETGIITLDLNQGFVMPENPTLENLPQFGIGTILRRFGEEYGETIDNLYWYGTADVAQTYVPLKETVKTIPDNLDKETWGLISATDFYYDNRIINVAIDAANNQIWFDNLSEKVPEAAIVGTINNDGTVSVKSKQFMGILNDQMIWFVVARYKNYDDYDYDMIDEVVFDFDKESKILTCINPDDLIAVNYYEDALLCLDYYLGPEARFQTVADECAAPRNPIFDNYRSYSEMSGNCWMIWKLPLANVNNYVCNPDNVYYNTFVDYELFTCEKDVYWADHLEEDMTDIPYNFQYNDEYGFTGWINSFHPGHLFYFFDGAQYFGCQTFYRAEDGTEYYSDLITYNVETGEVTNDGGATVSVKGVADNEPISETYTNVAGININNPTQGLYIKTVTMKDGSRKSTKVLLHQ